VLVPYLDKYPPDIQLAADITGQSVRTLQRHLARKGVTFPELLDQIRLQRAMRLIEDNGVRLGDVALDVRYSDSAHFNRAFRRWTGISPSQYRVQRSTDG